MQTPGEGLTVRPDALLLRRWLLQRERLGRGRPDGGGARTRPPRTPPTRPFAEEITLLRGDRRAPGSVAADRNPRRD